MTWKQAPPLPGCNVIDFRTECNPPSGGGLTTPAPVPAPAPMPEGGVPAASVDPVVPPADPAPIDPLLPPKDWNPPSWHFDAPSVGDVVDMGVTAGAGGLLTFAFALGLIRHARTQGLEPRDLGIRAAGAAVLPVGAIVIDESWTAPLSLLADAMDAAQLGGGYLVGALAATAITALPAGWTAAALWWSRQRQQEIDGHADNPKQSLRRQRRHEAAQARAGRKAAKARIPYTAGWPVPTHVVLGVCSKRTCATPETMWSALFSRHDSSFAIPLSSLDEHLFIIGGSGSGKTTLQLRLAAAVFLADWARYLAGGPRPLLVFLDCGGDADTARRFVEIAARLGIQPDRIGLWPDKTSLDLWDGKPEAITETLQRMVCPTAPTDSAQEYFFKARRRVIRLAMGTADHVGPRIPAPRSRRELFARMASIDALKALYPADKEIQAEITGFDKTKPPMVSSVLGILRDAWDTLGGALDTGKPLSAYDALYLKVPGTAMKDSARVQAAALLEMLIKYAASGDHNQVIRMFVDETSAVNDAAHDIGIVEAMERARKYRMSIVPSAQNVEGIGPTELIQKRIMKGASGGGILMRGRGMGEACEVFGTAPRSEATRHTLGGRSGDEGSTGISDKFLVTPEAIDEMEKGDAVYVNQRVAIWGHVTPIDPADLPRIEQTPDTLRRPVEPRARLRPVPRPPAAPFPDDPGDDDVPDLGEAAS